MASLSNVWENRLIDGLLRGGALNGSNAVNSASVVKGYYTQSLTYSLGDIVIPHNSMTGAGGKFLYCTQTGLCGNNAALAVPSVGVSISDNTVVWLPVSGIPSLPAVHVALFTAAPDDTGGGTEVSSSGYARVSVACTKAAWAATNAAGTTYDSSGTGGTSSNNAQIAFPLPTGNWGTVTHVALFDRASGGEMVAWGALASSRTINAGDGTPSFAAASLTFQIDD